MKYYLRKKTRWGYSYFYGDRYRFPSMKKKNKQSLFDTIEAAKSKGQELGGNFQIVNEGFQVVWPIK